ncbi:MAG: hypothetical protein ACRDLS_05725 [Solirubrobacteraceae bacterium]
MNDAAHGPAEIPFRLELTPAQLKITHTALHSLLLDFGHDERDVAAVVREVLDKLPSATEMRSIDLSAELARRRRRSADPPARAASHR